MKNFNLVVFLLNFLNYIVNRHSISELWMRFRECENKKDGRIPSEEFLRGVEKVLIQEEGLKWEPKQLALVLDLLFERFNYYGKSIDIYDFLISMSILSRMSNDEKISLILELMDVDEDSCLSIGEVFKMILAIEKNFIKELNYLNF